MGAWGVGPLQNDDAADWLANLGAALPEALLLTLTRVAALDQDLYLEEPAASEAVATAEIVAAMHGYPSPDVAETPEAVEWVRNHSNWLNPDVVQQAITAVTRVRSSSELLDLWSESPDFNLWTSRIDELLLRLSS